MSRSPQKKLAGAEWLNAPDLQKVMVALGHDHCRVVGGAVRDSILQRDIRDIDIATDHKPEEASRRLESAGIKVVPTGIAHGTVTAVVNGRPFEVTTLRHDVESFGRHARVAFHSDWEADAARRDFTMNALYVDGSGNLYDYFGGEEDIARGLVRFIGEPAERIEEDALRILRFFRFHAWYGENAPDADGLKACAGNAAKIDILSIERIRDELLKLLAAPDPAPVLAVMRQAGIIKHVLPGAVDESALDSLVPLEDAIGEVSGLRRLAAMLGREQAALERAGADMKLSNADSKRLAAMAGGDRPVSASLGGKALRAMVYSIGAETFTDRIILDNGPDDVAAVQDLIDDALAFTPPAFPVTGHDLEAAGIAPGPAMGDAMRALEEVWVAADFMPDKEELLKNIPAG